MRVLLQSCTYMILISICAILFQRVHVKQRCSTYLLHPLLHNVVLNCELLCIISTITTYFNPRDCRIGDVSSSCQPGWQPTPCRQNNSFCSISKWYAPIIYATMTTRFHSFYCSLCIVVLSVVLVVLVGTRCDYCVACPCWI